VVEEDRAMEPVGVPEPRATRLSAIVGGSVIVLVGLLIELIVVGLAIGFSDVEGNHHTAWYGWFASFAVFSFLSLPLVVPGALLVMRGVRGAPVAFRPSAQRAMRRAGLWMVVVAAAMAVVATQTGDATLALLVYTIVNLVVIGVIVLLLSTKREHPVTVDATHRRTVQPHG
jgi:hypothetical protein